MPVIEHVEVATGGYPFAGDKPCIFIVMDTSPHYVMTYTDAMITKVCKFLFDKTKVQFELDGKTDKRTIVNKDDINTTIKDKEFNGATDIKKDSD
ncbi:MAG: hypothetical protein JNJ77_16235 [Planctomycetia bacterium]|nr:hypothetical protein [Planctomycetia bacterium]